MANLGAVNPFPTSYEEWKHVVTAYGGLEFIPSVLEKRLLELSNSAHPATKEFIKLYGAPHYQQICTWYRQAIQETLGR